MQTVNTKFNQKPLNILGITERSTNSTL